MSLLSIDGALIQAYLDLCLDLPTAYEGVHFKPPESDWAAVFIVPASSDPATLGVNGSDRHTGFMQIDFNTEQGSGRATLIDYAQTVRDAFVAGKWFTQDGQNVRITSVSRTNIREVDGWMRLTVTVNFEADTIRPEI